MRKLLPAALWLLVTLGLLNLALSFHNLWPTLWVRASGELSLDLCVGLALLALYQSLSRTFPGVGLRVLLASALLLLIFGRYIQVTAPALFGRSLNLYWDLGHLPAVAAMTTSSRPLWQSLGVAVALGAAAAGLLWLLTKLVGLLCRALRLRPLRWLTLGCCALTLGVYTAGRLSPAWHSEHWFSLSVAAMYTEQLGIALRARAGPDPQQLPPPPPPVAARPDAAVDVQLLFLESYGAVVRDSPDFARALAPAFASLEQAASGWHSASAWLQSPTFGGASWLAHASVLSGTSIRSEDAYRLLLASGRGSLVQRFRAAGYRAVALLPGMKKPWPEGHFYGFDHIYRGRDIDYPGPAFGWWEIPDQYSLDWLRRREADARKPLLLFFASVMSHAPFEPIPPYLPDWERLRGAEPYSRAEHRAALDYAAAAGHEQMYPAAIRYDLAVLGGLLRRLRGTHTLIVALGDHQPPAYVSGPDASRQVPVHVFSPDRVRLRSFLQAGFDRAAVPTVQLQADLASLYPLLLHAAAGTAAPR